MADRTLLNLSRPPVFCPGCSHDSVLRTLDKTFVRMGLNGRDIAMVSDIGCSGLFDTFFNTHAFHGLHGRALTYASGLKLSRPDLNVVVTMGDGGLGIGGAHVLAACRKNLDITLLVLNNFNFGMTGGQCSATTPNDAQVSSGFLNRLDRPLDLYGVATAAGAPFVMRCSAYQKDLSQIMEQAINYKGFAILEIEGVCPGRYTKRNKITPKTIQEGLDADQRPQGPIPENQRTEYGDAYRAECEALEPLGRPLTIEKHFNPPFEGRVSVSLQGSAGQRAITAGELLGLAAQSAGLYATQKNEYNITVLRGPSITELNFSPVQIGYTGIEKPDVVLALAPEGVERRKEVYAKLGPETLVIQAAGVEIPETGAQVRLVDFKGQGLKNVDWSLASLAVLAKLNKVITLDMLNLALENRFKGKVLEISKVLVTNVEP
ncbi:thiamine pyrophosphate-dependent enzyme [Dethiosulfatarculus sandiegensis]|uniref:2-oxoglutarate synthase n=1 Tax=Dethiosulfatarculus sandiegensis TaxID=1429043 RepID=A0A0D2GGU1_9BACT|nr:thiamine pyrophosphate-dependent enzyme [Dethiosulfatarculus sandiegensis]KIX14142.1 2-oxoglutarate synthase [Dethiosulfatarculus sandiegensis]